MKIQVKRKEIMDGHFSVFNSHINDADKRAREVMKTFFLDDLKNIEAIEKQHNGIMAIFDCEPKCSTVLYVGLVTAFVNEK